MIYKTPPEIGEVRDCWITRVSDTYTVYASGYEPTYNYGKATHSQEAIDEGVQEGYDGEWNPWNPNESYGLGRGVQSFLNKQPLPYFDTLEEEKSIKTQAVYLGRGDWKIL